MNYDRKAPCVDCPFLREGGIRLTKSRIIEITRYMLDSKGGTFACHNEEPTHCAGALIFAEKNRNETQMMRIAWRLGLYNPDELEGFPRVFDTAEEMLGTALERPKKRKKRSAK